MSKIKVFCAGLWFVTQGIGVAPTPILASSGGEISSCAKDDALIITLVSAGILVLEKISEKIYSYCMARHNRNQNSEMEQTNGLENIIDDNTTTRQTEQTEDL